MKTLKDIDSDCKVCNDLQKLRQSAIEDIKSFNKTINNDPIPGGWIYKQVVEYIKKKFDINERDLK